MAKPKLLLLDEPVAGVNPTLAREIGDHLRGLVADGISMLFMGAAWTPSRRCAIRLSSWRKEPSATGLVRGTRGRSRRAGSVYGPAPMSLLVVSDIVAGYGRGDEILKGVHLTVEDKEIVAIIGPNGAGKSTLLKTIAGLLRPESGSITLRGAPIHSLAPREVSRLGVAFVPQEQNIFATLSVRENLGDGWVARACRDAPAYRRGVRAVSDAGGAPRQRSTHVVRWTASGSSRWRWR